MAEEQVKVNIDNFANFKKAIDGMVAKSDKSWNDHYNYYYQVRRTKDYTKKEVEDIINSSSLLAMQKLSRTFFYRDGLYKRILLYYATLLKYVGILIPNPIAGNELSTPYVQKKYDNALTYFEKVFSPELFTHFSLRALIDGCYYGVFQEISKQDLVVLDLPAEYCRSNFRDLHGNDIIEFDVGYFDSITDENDRRQALKVYPKVIRDYYYRLKKGLITYKWVKIPTDIGFCFPFSDDGRPLFLDLIPAVMDYDEAVDINRERDLEEIRKIIVQKIPHLADGALLFEPDEALEMHAGAVGMMKGNKNISVLTTYADVDAVVSKTSSEATNTALEKSLQNVYSRASVSGQLFAPTGSQALNISITNDMSLMMILANKYSRFVTYIINFLFANSNINFKYSILPVSWYNVSQYITDTLKLAQSGYSYLLPAIAAGLSQKDLMNVKKLENDALDLGTLLIPLASSYTQSSGQVGRPELPLEEKSPKTIQNEQSLDNQ